LTPKEIRKANKYFGGRNYIKFIERDEKGGTIRLFHNDNMVRQKRFECRSVKLKYLREWCKEIRNLKAYFYIEISHDE